METDAEIVQRRIRLLQEARPGRRPPLALVSVGSALAYETLWTLRERDRREKERCERPHSR